MARRVITLDEKIRKAEAAVATSKAKYDDALDELKKLGAEIQTTDTKCVIKDPKAKTREFPGTTIFNLDYIYL